MHPPKISIRKGTIQEVVKLSHLLPEFENPHSIEAYQKRLDGVQSLILIAEVNGEPAGFKVGYDRDKDGSFYSWMGGVLPKFRRMGLARQLAEYQEEWAMKNGYKKIRFKTRNSHKKMLIFALLRGFYLLEVVPYADPQSSRILLEKRLTD